MQRKWKIQVEREKEREREHIHPSHAFQSFMTYFANVSVALESSIGLQNGDDISSGRIAKHPIEWSAEG